MRRFVSAVSMGVMYLVTQRKLDTVSADVVHYPVPSRAQNYGVY